MFEFLFKNRTEKFVDENGKVFLTREVDKNNRCNGKIKEFNQKGIKIFEASYKKGKLHGNVTYYDDDGNPISELIFRNNKLIEYDT